MTPNDPLHTPGTNWDITAQQRVEQAQHASEANFRTFFESMSDMIFVSTLQGWIIVTNSAVTRTLGYTLEELTGKHLLDMHPAGVRQECEVILAAMFRGERDSCPLPLVRKDGSLVPAETKVWQGIWNGEACLFGMCKNLTEEQEAAQRFERLFRNNPSSSALSSLPGDQFLDVNDAFLKTLGYTLEEVIGRTSAELALFVHQEQVNRIAHQLQAEGRLESCELQVRCKDGRILDGLFSGELIRNQGQQFLLVTMVDITLRKHAEAELARLSVMQNAVMHLATDFVNVPVAQQDAAICQSLETIGGLIGADLAYLSAYDFANGLCSNTHEWCGPGIPPQIDKLQAVEIGEFSDWVEAHQRGEVVHIPSVETLPADGRLRQVLKLLGTRSAVALPLMHEGVCLGFVGFDAMHEERLWRQDEIALLRVLAELYAHFEVRRAAERRTEELQRGILLARDQAQAAAQSKSLFLANMSHEIRTPLNAVLGYAQIMERECRDCEHSGKLKAISRSGEHLQTLITDLLELVRSDARTINPEPSEFDFHQVLEDVRLMFIPTPEARDLALEVACAPDVPQYLYADPGKVRQILVNLVGNALKFTAAGGVRLTASVRPEGAAEGFLVTVDVEDTGCGIDPDDLEHIFEVFEQAEPGRRSGKGAGLGLPLSRRYARALGGDVTVVHSETAGSHFRFTFHARPASRAGTGSCDRPRVSHLALDQVACRVLVVDDDPENCEMLSLMLQSAGFAAEAVASARQALRRLAQGARLDVVLMDKHMPGMDGYEAIRRIRELPGGRELAVLVVTASGFADEKELALAAGADGYVAKPVRRAHLLEELGRVAGIRYAYESPRPAALDPAALACLSAEQRVLLARALSRGDIQCLRDLIAGIARDNACLAAGMQRLLDGYDYDHLRGLLASANTLTL